MTNRTKLLLILIILLTVALACSLTPSEETPVPVDQAAIETSVAATTAAQLTENAPPTNTPPPPPTDTPDPDTIYAPNPLGPGYTGLIFDEGTCYDFDTYLPVAAGDPTRDICMHTFGLLEPENGGLISGSAPMDPPSKGYCINPSLLPDPVAIQTDLYLCFQTNLGVFGFFVSREYQMDLDRVIFDMYVFP